MASEAIKRLLIQKMFEHQRAKKIAEKTPEIFGQPERQELAPPPIDELIPGDAYMPGMATEETAPATGLYDTTQTPKEQFTGLNQRLMASGMPSLQSQALQNISAMQKQGVGGGVSDPASVREFKYLQQQFPEKKWTYNDYLNMKRQGYTIKKIGNVPSRIPLQPGEKTTPLSTLEKEAESEKTLAGEKRRGAIEGETLAKAQIDLPKVEDAATELMTLTEELLAHPGKGMALGKSGVIPAIPGTDYADFMTRYKQVGGKQFMQAYQDLKGGGQITEIEGEQARDALARMSRAQSEPSFNKAVKDFQKVVMAGLRRARKLAGFKERKQQSQSIMSQKDSQALEWARQNPNDPRATKIIQRLGTQ